MNKKQFLIKNGGYTLLEIYKHLAELERFYSLLQDEFSRFIFIQVLSFRIMGYRKVKLPLSVPEYWNAIKRLEEMAEKDNVSEQNALKGAINTLKRFKPQLAISIYHNFADDFASIANMLDELKLGYRFFLGHFSIHHEETVLFASTKERL